MKPVWLWGFVALPLGLTKTTAGLPRAEFWCLGLGELWPISGLHGDGVSNRLARVALCKRMHSSFDKPWCANTRLFLKLFAAAKIASGE